MDASHRDPIPEPPDVHVSGKAEHGILTLSCHAYGFYPSTIAIRWMKGMKSGIAPNRDSTFQPRAGIEALPEEREQHRCRVEHPGMPEIGIFSWGGAGNVGYGNWEFGNVEQRDGGSPPPPHHPVLSRAGIQRESHPGGRCVIIAATGVILLIGFGVWKLQSVSPPLNPSWVPRKPLKGIPGSPLVSPPWWLWGDPTNPSVPPRFLLQPPRESGGRGPSAGAPLPAAEPAVRGVQGSLSIWGPLGFGVNPPGPQDLPEHADAARAQREGSYPARGPQLCHRHRPGTPKPPGNPQHLPGNPNLSWDPENIPGTLQKLSRTAKPHTDPPKLS